MRGAQAVIYCAGAVLHTSHQEDNAVHHTRPREGVQPVM